MSGRWVSYWRLPSEEEELFACLEKDEPVVAMAIRGYPNEGAIKWRPLRDALADGAHAILITPRRFEKELRVTDEFAEGGWAPSVPLTPAIYYAAGVKKARTLSPTVLSASWDRYDLEKRKHVPFPAEYVKWARRVMQWAAKRSPKTEAAAAESKKGLQLIK